MGIDILGIDILGVDIVGIDILALPCLDLGSDHCFSSLSYNAYIYFYNRDLKFRY